MNNCPHQTDIGCAYLVLGSSLLTESLDGRDTDSQVVATDVVELSLLDERPDVGRLQVIKLVLVGGSEVSAHAAVVAGDDNTTLAGRDVLIDAVLGMDTGLLAGLLEDVTVLVLTNAANVHDGVFRKHVLDHLSVSIVQVFQSMEQQ